MAGRFVRASKYRHVFGKPTKKEFCYDNLRISRNAWDTNLIKVNPEYLSVNWDTSGGGAFAVIPLSERGKLPDQIPLFRGHTASVLDTDWHPFNDRIIASASEDGKVFLWEVPADFTLYTDAEDIMDVAPKHKLGGHPRKFGQVLFNPSAENILASASGEFTIKIWDISTGQAPLTLKHADILQSLSWNAAGSMLVTTSRDKKVRVWDVRQEKAVHETPGHGGAKNSRAVWLGEHNRFATTGFSRMSERQVALWEPGRMEPIGGFMMLDSISGVCMPFWDEGSNCLYLAGKGDGNIRYFEYENDKFEFLSEHKSPDPQRGIAFIPRRGINVHENEVMRAYKTVNDAYIEPISFTVPRRAESFQSDIFPPATGSKAFSTAKEWLDGKMGVPAKIDLESVYEGTAPREIMSDYKAPPQPTPAAAAPSSGAPKGKPESSRGETKKEEARPVTTTAPSVASTKPREPPPSLDEQKASIFAIARKFQESKEEANGDDEDETSSFEEVSRPAQRPTFPAISAEPQAMAPPTKTQSAPAPAPAPRPSPVTQKPEAVRSGPTPTGAAAPARDGGSGLEASIDQIKQLLEKQTRVISAQNDKIGLLVTEMEALKKRVGSGSQDQSERIRQLELELEEARS